MKLEDVIKSLDMLELHASNADNSQHGSLSHSTFKAMFKEEKNKLIAAIREFGCDKSESPEMTPSECLKLLNVTRLELRSRANTCNAPFAVYLHRRADAIQWAINRILAFDAAATKPFLPKDDRRSASEIIETLRDVWNMLASRLKHDTLEEGARVTLLQMDCLRLAIWAIKDRGDK